MDVIYHAACSLDGFIATEHGTVDWLTPFQESGDDHGFTEFFASVDSLLMGSHTYEFMLEHPPWLAPDKPSLVFTSRDLPSADESVEFTNQTPREALAGFRSRGLKRTWLMGGGQLATALRKDGLITEYRIALVPVILGAGIPLFARSPQLDQFDELQLTDTKIHSSGIVQLTHVPKPPS